MLLSLHGVFLAYLLVALLWNLSCSATEKGPPAWERRWLLPIQVALTLALVIDALRPAELPLLGHVSIAALFPLALALGLFQNLAAVKSRGARLTDIPILLANTGLLVCEGLGVVELAGGQLPTKAAALLYDHSILQHLLGGSSLAHLSTLSWHVPLLVPRREAQSIPGLLARLVIAALGGFIALMLGGLLGTAREVMARFEEEPRVTALRPGLQVRVFDDAVLDLWSSRFAPDGPPFPAAISGSPHPPRIVEIAPPAAWNLRLPEPEARVEIFLATLGAVSADVVLPFPEPDGLGSLLLGVRTPEEWRGLFERAAQRVHEISPGTRLAVRLVGTGERSRALLAALAAEPSPVDIAGPRLVPGSPESGGPAAMDGVLDTWAEWRAALPRPPELWILSAGCSVPAYGEIAQARFVEGCLARASARSDVAGILLEGGFDQGHTLGLRRADGTPRLAATRLAELLGRR
jgi:hypothetical protein